MIWWGLSQHFRTRYFGCCFSCLSTDPALIYAWKITMLLAIKPHTPTELQLLLAKNHHFPVPKPVRFLVLSTINWPFLQPRALPRQDWVLHGVAARCGGRQRHGLPARRWWTTRGGRAELSGGDVGCQYWWRKKLGLQWKMVYLMVIMVCLLCFFFSVYKPLRLQWKIWVCLKMGYTPNEIAI